MSNGRSGAPRGFGAVRGRAVVTAALLVTVGLTGCAGRGTAERRDAVREAHASTPAASSSANAEGERTTSGAIDPAVVAGIESAIADADRVAAGGEGSVAQDG